MNIDHQFIKNTVRAHYLMNLGTYISELTDISGARLAYTNRFSNIWYNSAYDLNIDTDEVDNVLDQIEHYMIRHDRQPCIYVSPATKPSNIRKILASRGYDKVETEAWMFCDFSQYPKPYTRPAEITIREAQTDTDFEIFADIYRRGMPSREADLQIQACIDGFKYKPPMVDIQYYMASYDGEPAGMLSSLSLGEYNGLYSGATIEKFRDKNIMRCLMHHATSVALQKGIKYQLFQTVAGTRAEIVYAKLGYLTLYQRECYTLS